MGHTIIEALIAIVFTSSSVIAITYFPKTIVKLLQMLFKYTISRTCESLAGYVPGYSPAGLSLRFR